MAYYYTRNHEFKNRKLEGLRWLPLEHWEKVGDFKSKYAYAFGMANATFAFGDDDDFSDDD